MKKKIIFLMLVASFVFIGCSEDPESVVKKVFHAIDDGDLDTVKQNTSIAIHAINTYFPESELFYDNLSEHSKNMGKILNVSVVKQFKDYATIEVTFKNGKDMFLLTKKDKKWKMNLIHSEEKGFMFIWDHLLED